MMVKDILKCGKTGHGCTLDPKVTGVLPICLNRAQDILKDKKVLERLRSVLLNLLKR